MLLNYPSVFISLKWISILLKINRYIIIFRSLTMFLYLLKDDLKNIIRSFQIVSTIGNYDFFNQFIFRLFNRIYNFFGMITIDDFIIQGINKNYWNYGFQSIFGEVYLKRSETFFNFIIKKQFLKRIL
jgi:hypothetical protein